MATRSRERTWGIVALLAAVSLWSGSLSMVRVAVTTATPGTVTFWRCVVGAVVLGAWVLVRARNDSGRSEISRARSAPRARGGWHGWCWAIGSGATCGAAFLLIATGMQSVGSGPAGIVLSMIPGLTILLTTLEGRMHGFGPRHALSLGLGGLGALTLAATAGGGWSVIGLVMLALAALAHAATNVTSGHSLERLDATVVAAVSMAVAAIVSLPFASFGHAMPIRSVLAIAVLGVLPSGLAYVMYFHGIRVLGTERAAYSNFLVPPVAVVAGMVTLGEVPDGATILALVFAMLALYVGIGGRDAPGPVVINGPVAPDLAPPNVVADVSATARNCPASRDQTQRRGVRG